MTDMKLPLRDLRTEPLTDGEAEKVLAVLAVPVKKRKTTHWKAVAKAAVAAVAERQTEIDAMQNELADAEVVARLAVYDVAFWRRVSLVLVALFALAVVWR
mgnify:FL=1